MEPSGTVVDEEVVELDDVESEGVDVVVLDRGVEVLEVVELGSSCAATRGLDTAETAMAMEARSRGIRRLMPIEKWWSRCVPQDLSRELQRSR